ncbi:MAG: helix-turn-helix transcriptional regulator [Clostridiales Family XIII bacterium]|jgi:transcriptional regulator with XRE-family HTH domain|nr:helix-turn-helix transcriptional regulator [Clostridiales Family XIII bacterium]
MNYSDTNRENFDFAKIGREIKAERERRDWTREQAAVRLDISESYLKAIENNGCAPGFQLFYRIMTLFRISVDKYFFPNAATDNKSRDASLYLRAAGLLREREAGELYVLISAMDSMDALKKKTDDEEGPLPTAEEGVL